MGRLAALLLSCLFLQKGMAQSTYLHLSEQEMQEIIGSPSSVDERIRELQRLADSTTSLAEEVSALQTIILLEPHSANSFCELTYTYNSISELLMRMDASEAGILMTHKAMQMGKRCDSYTEAQTYNHIGKLGSFHMLAHNLDSALYYFRWAEMYSDTVRDPIWHAGALNNLGMVWTEIGKLDSAYSYYNQAIFGLDPSLEEHQVLLGSITDNLAQWHRDKGNHTVALQLFSENINRYRNLKDTLGVVKSMLGTAEAYMDLDRTKDAEPILDSIKAWIFPYTKFPNLRAKQVMTYQRLRKRECLSRKDLPCAMNALEESLVWQQRIDSIRSRTKQLIIGSLNQGEIWRFNREVSLRNRQCQLQDLADDRLGTIRLLGGVVAALLLALGFVLLKRRSGKRK